MRYKSYEPPYTIPEIVRMRSEGLTYSQIGNHFGVSSSRIGHILKREEEKQFAAGRSATILEETSARNDIDRKLSISDLFCVMNLSKRAEAVLKKHFSSKNIAEFSLREMMDFLLPIVHGSGDYYDYLPAYRVKTLGIILYSEMVGAMSSMDGGETCEQVWTGRKEQLRNYFGEHHEPFYQAGRWAKALA